MNTQIRPFFSLTMTLIYIISSILLSCNKDNSQDKADNGGTINTGNSLEMELDFQFVNRGASYQNTNVYVSWIESNESGFIQNIVVCERLINNTLTGTVLPYWKVNIYPDSKGEADAISSATIKNRSFKVDFTLKDSTIREFSIYFETDLSNEYNDWFTDKRDQGAPDYVQDQPAILYRADVNLNNSNIKIYELELYAWTPNDETEDIIDGLKTGSPILETRYITNKKDNGTFGDWDNEHRIDRMVGSITLTIK